MCRIIGVFARYRNGNIPNMIKIMALFSPSSCTRLLLWTLLMVASAMSSVHARNTKSVQDPNLQTIRALLEKPEDQVDLAKAKLTIDRMIDPSVLS